MLCQVNILDVVVGGTVFILLLSVWIGAVILLSIRRTAKTQKIQKRIGLVGQEGPVRQLTLWHEGKEVTTLVPGKPQRPPLMQQLEQICQDAGMSIGAPALLAVTAVLAMLAFACVGILSKSSVLGLVAAGAMVMVIWIYIKQRATKRILLFEKQFIDGLELAARSLRAGHPLIASFRVIAEEVPEPVGQIFSRICQEQAIGLSLEQSLREVAAASKSSDLKLFTTSVEIQLRSGGNLADMMDRLAAVIRGRMRLNRHIRVLTAQTQLSKRILLALPILLFVILNVLNPGYMHPLYTDPLGKTLLIIAGLGLVLGSWLMNRMAQLKY